MATRSEQLYFGPLPEGGSVSTLCGPSVNEIFLVKTIRIHNPNPTGAIQVTLYLTDVVHSVQMQYINAYDLAAQETLLFDFWHVIKNGDLIEGRTGATGINIAECLISGTRLPVP